MPPGVSSGQVFRFGVFEADVAEMTLTRKGARVKIQDQPFRVLVLLLERAGEVVTREELREKLWPDGIHVDFDGSLNVTLKKLRTAIDDSPENPVFIETVPRRGYRFIAPVSGLESRPEPSARETDEAGPSYLQSPSSSPEFKPRAFSFSWRRGIVLAALLILLLLGAWQLSSRNAPQPAASAKVIAVLPFANEGAGPDFDYLRYAIANDLISDLIPSPSVSVRPFASTKPYGLRSAEPAGAGRELQVTYVVTGGFLLDHKQLHVHMELVDVARNRSVWADQITIPPEQLIALHEQLAFRTAHGLLVALDVLNASPDAMPRPTSEEALNLFLHSLTIPLDPGPNQLAIARLERSVSLDDQYEPAWEELAWRYYIDYSYGNGGQAALAKSIEATRRAELFPGSTANTVTIRVEQGDLEGAYKEAAMLLRKRPEVGSFHYEMSYVLRYAGLLAEAGQQCDSALALDPGYNLYRSCATPFIFLGDYDHAGRYIRLDQNSGFVAKLRMLMALRKGDTAAALAESNAVTQTGYKFAQVASLYLTHAPEAQLRKAVAELEADPRAAQDPEVFYLNAAVLSFSRQDDAALRQLRRAIDGNHCSYPAIDRDPLFDTIRQRPEFAALRQAGIQCQSRFLAARQRTDAELSASH